MAIVPPFALFLLAELDTEDINERLTRAHYQNGVVEPSWDLWLAGNVYEEAPKQDDFTATVAPVSHDFKSPWVGKSIYDCAKWLSKAPGDVDLSPHYFTAIDVHCKNEDTVLVCRWFVCGDAFEVEYFPQSTDEVSMYMFTNWGDMFEDRAHYYKERMKREGKSDRSRYVRCKCGGEERCLR